jgi:hypothetical protein
MTPRWPTPLLLALGLAACGPAEPLTVPEAPPAGPALLAVDFETAPVGPYDEARLRADFGRILWAALDGRFSRTDDGALRVALPAGAVGPRAGGGQFVAAFAPQDEAWLSYRLRFAPGFDFRLGGKLPGLASGHGQYSGGNLPTAGDGWTARFIWDEQQRLSVYAYHAGLPGPWGERMALAAPPVEAGRWYTLTQRIRLNQGAADDGELEVWLDGRLVLHRRDIPWRRGEQGRIDALFFSVFHGGNTPDWAPRHDSALAFDDFRVIPAVLPPR